MQHRTLGSTGLELSVIGLGTWAMGGGGWKFGWGPQEDRDSIRAIHAAADIGINWIDTAAVYGLGHSEEVVGQALKERPGSMLVATKCGRVWDSDGQISCNISADSIRRECENSLRRLQVEVIDLYQIHWPEPDEQVEEGWEAVCRLKEEGKIRHGGVCNFNVEQLRRAGASQPVGSLQPPYHMLRRDVEDEILPFCGEQKIGVVVYSPMGKGMLTGKVTPEWVDGLAQDDHRRIDPMFNPPQLEVNLDKVRRLRVIAQRIGCRPAQLAIAWVLRRPEVTSAIVGVRNAEQAEQTSGVAGINLSADDLEDIERILA